ncbi:hypothetical protein DPEC_G00182390 [Dallia pectoralis]|uniref:Uncharacterized protein n=1 Tax=Dallia pectoralis TaxID=75939 RepID=A0ACC2GAJ6_DALPE|nr:hypothetical protein DPEC_G00182390 [Dallia pectoralis]
MSRPRPGRGARRGNSAGGGDKEYITVSFADSNQSHLHPLPGGVRVNPLPPRSIRHTVAKKISLAELSRRHIDPHHSGPKSMSQRWPEARFWQRPL